MKLVHKNSNGAARRFASLVGGVLLLSTLFVPIAGADTVTEIYLENAQGIEVNVTEYYGIQEGHIYSLNTGEIVGYLDNDIIVNANNQQIGMVTVTQD